MKISYFEEDTRFPSFLKKRKLTQALTKIIDIESSKSINYINIIVCSDEYLLDINTRFLQHNYYTDIITFDYNNNFIESDIYISLDRIIENAEKNSVTLRSEFHRVIIHGVLHLCGYKDATKEEQVNMRQKENFYITFIE